MTAGADRVATAVEAAKQLGVSTRRLYAMKDDSPWWRAEFRTEAGWDVEAISQAQAEYGEATSSESSNIWVQRQREAKAKLLELELEQVEARLEAERANILPRHVFEDFRDQLFAILRDAAETIPKRVAAKAPKAARSAIWNAKGNSPVQREFQKLVEDVGEWLKRNPEIES